MNHTKQVIFHHLLAISLIPLINACSLNGSQEVELGGLDIWTHFSGPLTRELSLGECAENGNIDGVKALLARGVGADSHVDGWEATPLYRAAMRGHEDVVLELLKAKADIEGAATEGKYTPLFIAINQHEIGTAKILIEAGANVNVKIRNNETPLHRASRIGSAELVKLLLAAKACPNAQDAWGRTPLHEATTWHGGTQIVDMLITAGAIVNIASK